MEPQMIKNTETINKSKTSSDIEKKYDIDRLQCCNQSQYLGIEKNLQGSRYRNLMKVLFGFKPEQTESNTECNLFNI